MTSLAKIILAESFSQNQAEGLQASMHVKSYLCNQPLRCTEFIHFSPQTEHVISTVTHVRYIVDDVMAIVYIHYQKVVCDSRLQVSELIEVFQSVKPMLMKRSTLVSGWCRPV
jgi:hypothetical protein